MGNRLLRAAALAWMLALAGCTTTVVAPADVDDPDTVYLLDFGNTPGLALPGDPVAAYYVFGDWNWYALRNTGILDGVRALFWPTQGTLGRRLLDGPLEAASTQRALHARAEHVHPIVVSRERALALRRRLDAEFGAAEATRVHAVSLDREFVQHPRAYTGWHNSNHQVRDWLLELGCEAQGTAFLSRWRVEPGTAGRDIRGIR